MVMAKSSRTVMRDLRILSLMNENGEDGFQGSLFSELQSCDPSSLFKTRDGP